MTTTRQLIDLFRAIADDNLDAAKAEAARLCKTEERQGHPSAARQLRGALFGTNGSSARGQSQPRTLETAAIVSSALVRLRNDRKLSDVVLSPMLRRELENVITEWRNTERLRKHDLTPRSKLLFHGPPGCGKSITAQALGTALGLPVYMVRFDAVIGAFLGQTAIHLRQLFHFAETTPCILLLDELDALGKRRGNPLDVGELDRIVISLLQELEHSKPMGIVIGTTNLATHLDDALWRRFDLDLLFKAPTPTILRRFGKKIATDKKFHVPRDVVERAAKTRSFAAAERIILAEARRQIVAQAKTT